MTFVQHLARRPELCPAKIRPRFRAIPRLALGSGERVGCTVRLPAGVPVSTALELACELAQSSRLLVSFAVAPPFQALPALAAAALLQAGTAPDRLELTVSRSGVEQAGIEALLALSAMRDQGIGIALRGFAARTAGLVPRLPLSAVVFSPGAICAVPGSTAATASIAALLRVVRSHGLCSVVTGIETEAQRALLSGLGCDAGEGSLFGTAIRTREAA